MSDDRPADASGRPAPGDPRDIPAGPDAGGQHENGRPTSASEDLSRHERRRYAALRRRIQVG